MAHELPGQEAHETMTAAPAGEPGARGGRDGVWLLAAALLWAIVLAVVLAHAAVEPNRNTLYKVFRAGGERWLAGKNVYPQVDEYIYSPLVAAGFAPLALMPDRVSGVLWRIISCALYAGAFHLWLRQVLGGQGNGRSRAVAWIALLPLSVGDFYNGQANPLVIGMVMLAILAGRDRRWWLAAFCIAVPAYFKVYPVAMGLLLAVPQPARFTWRLLVMLIVFFAFSLVLQWPSYALKQYGNWIHALGQDPRRTLNYFGTYRDFWLFLRIAKAPIDPRGWAVLQAVSGTGLAIYLFVLKQRGLAEDLLYFLVLALGTCWMLLFGPATESSTYIILAPPLILAWWVRGKVDHRRSLLAAWGAAYSLLIASQMLSSWAHQFQNAYTHAIQPLGALAFAIYAILLANHGLEERKRGAA